MWYCRLYKKRETKWKKNIAPKEQEIRGLLFFTLKVMNVLNVLWLGSVHITGHTYFDTYSVERFFCKWTSCDSYIYLSFFFLISVWAELLSESVSGKLIDNSSLFAKNLEAFVLSIESIPVLRCNPASNSYSQINTAIHPEANSDLGTKLVPSD